MLDYEITQRNMEATLEILERAVRMADRYLNSYDTSKPSRVKVETRIALEEAMACLKSNSKR